MSISDDTGYRALVAEEVEGKFLTSIKTLPVSSLPTGNVLVKVLYSSLNYKDALSASGNKGITRQYPHTPGIDSCGIVVSSVDQRFKAGDTVLVCSYDMGMNTAGGFGQYIRVPADWVMLLPVGLTPVESMMLGTAGFTAALAIHQMQLNGQNPLNGPVLVTGSTGGLGSLAVNILHKLGYTVIASTGKESHHSYLKSIGASSIISREEVNDTSGKYLLRDRWAGAIDTVGGNILATVIKACKKHGNVACCGNANSYELNTTVFPFILNGINLLGIETATWPMESRRMLWNKLANEWKPQALHQISTIVPLDDLPSQIDRMLQGKSTGRIVVDLN